LLEADGLTVTEGTVIVRALQLYREHPRLDFADAYLAAMALEVGPAAVTSFDADFDGVEGIRRISI
jgi:predicted nucleic acid-binding protein